MAVYKVAQDVEADDHLLGPFTPRQFIYLVITAMAGAIAFFLGKLFMPLAIIPLPIILFFGMLALPLRKDQPMEVYFAAIISYHLKPRKRFWIPDGLTSLIEITAPQAIEEQRTKDFSGSEAENRLSYLASIVDTEGWALRHVAANSNINQNTSMISDVYNDALATQDPLDNASTVAQGFDNMLNEATERRRQEIMAHMHSPEDFTTIAQPAAALAPPPPFTDPYANIGQQTMQPAPAPQQPSDIHFNPYPTIHQSVVQPIVTASQTPPNDTANVNDGSQAALAQTNLQYSNQLQAQNTAQQTSKSTSETTVSPDIINLVNNPDLSIETIAREAHRIKDKDEGEEVVISLR